MKRQTPCMWEEVSKQQTRQTPLFGLGPPAGQTCPSLASMDLSHPSTRRPMVILFLGDHLRVWETLQVPVFQINRSSTSLGETSQVALQLQQQVSAIPGTLSA